MGLLQALLPDKMPRDLRDIGMRRIDLHALDAILGRHNLVVHARMGRDRRRLVASGDQEGRIAYVGLFALRKLLPRGESTEVPMMRVPVQALLVLNLLIGSFVAHEAAPPLSHCTTTWSRLMEQWEFTCPDGSRWHSYYSRWLQRWETVQVRPPRPAPPPWPGYPLKPRPPSW